MSPENCAGRPLDELWFAQLERAKVEPWSTQIGACLACHGRTAGCRFGIVRESAIPNGLELRAVLGPEHAGGPGVAHGGVIAGILDEALGHVPISKGVPAVTASMLVEYLRPVPLHAALIVVSHVAALDGRSWTINGQMSLASSGSLLARASGRFVEIQPDHYERHRRSITGEL